MSAGRLEAHGAGRVAVHGDVDFDTVPALWSQLKSQLDGGDWVLDLSPVGRVNSAGLALLLEAHAETRRQGGRMRVEGLPEGLAQLATVSGLDDMLAEWQA
jgi:phospholipid transport system transporter-binding protein